MKKTAVMVLILVAVVFVCTAGALAASPGGGRAFGNGCHYPDADGDGLCDRCGSESGGSQSSGSQSGGSGSGGSGGHGHHAR